MALFAAVEGGILLGEALLEGAEALEAGSLFAEGGSSLSGFFGGVAESASGFVSGIGEGFSGGGVQMLQGSQTLGTMITEGEASGSSLMSGFRDIGHGAMTVKGSVDTIHAVMKPVRSIVKSSGAAMSVTHTPPKAYNSFKARTHNTREGVKGVQPVEQVHGHHRDSKGEPVSRIPVGMGSHYKGADMEHKPHGILRTGAVHKERYSEEHNNTQSLLL
jgi:hypothetical protein